MRHLQANSSEPPSAAGSASWKRRGALIPILLGASFLITLAFVSMPREEASSRTHPTIEENSRHEVPEARMEIEETASSIDLPPASAPPPTTAMIDIAAPAGTSPQVKPLPPGWGFTNSDAYAAETDYSVHFSGAASLRLSSRSEEPNGPSSVGQVIRADAYRGKRVKLAGHLSTMNVRGWAGLWFRIDSADGRVLAFDNMGAADRSLRGNTSWKESSLVLDVPEEADAMYFGTALVGAGTVWMDSFRIEVVDEDTPLTARNSPTRIVNPRPPGNHPSSPRNLDFEP